MTRYLIEIPHENSKQACDRAVRAFVETGSHFMTNADWGCDDDEHKAWFIADLDSKEEALSILPPSFRINAKIITLRKFSMEDAEKTIEQHADQA